MIYHHRQTKGPFPARFNHLSRPGYPHCSAVGGWEINAIVKLETPAKRVATIAEVRSNAGLPPNRVAIGHGCFPLEGLI